MAGGKIFTLSCYKKKNRIKLKKNVTLYIKKFIYLFFLHKYIIKLSQWCEDILLERTERGRVCLLSVCMLVGVGRERGRLEGREGGEGGRG